MSTEVFSLNTGWIDGKECLDCGEVFHHTVEFKFFGIYCNMCTCCFNEFKAGLNNE